jgi:hypothetical protein
MIRVFMDYTHEEATRFLMWLLTSSKAHKLIMDMRVLDSISPKVCSAVYTELKFYKADVLNIWAERNNILYVIRYGKSQICRLPMSLVREVNYYMNHMPSSAQLLNKMMTDDAEDRNNSSGSDISGGGLFGDDSF